MSQNKYIGTKEAVRLTGLSTQEIYDLIHEGKLPARKAPKSGWRIFPQDLADLGLIHGEADNIVETSLQEDAYSYVERWDRFLYRIRLWDKSCGRAERIQ